MKKIPWLFTPVPDKLVEQYGYITALVYGKIWRYCDWSGTDQCTASLNTLSTQLGISKNTLVRKLNILMKDGWIKRIKSGKSKKEPSVYEIITVPTEGIVLYPERVQSTEQTVPTEGHKDTKILKDTGPLTGERTAGSKINLVSRYEPGKSRDWMFTWMKALDEQCWVEERGYTSAELKILLKEKMPPHQKLMELVDKTFF
jgi:DNA-binding Lrp family transcriptional regulator